MKILLNSALLTLWLSIPLAADTNVSIAIGEPGFYGLIEIADYPRPRLIYREPVLVKQVVHPGPPVYLVVPPGHARHWADHCHEYGFCGRQVYFVEEVWYEEIYVPEFRKRHGHPGKGKGKKHKDRR